MRTVFRPELASMAWVPRMYSPGIMSSSDGLVHGYKFGSVRECSFDLNLADHFGNSFHNVRGGEYLRSQCDEFRDGFAVANFFQKICGNQCDSFRVVEFQTAAPAFAREFAGRENHQLVDFTRSQM